MTVWNFKKKLAAASICILAISIVLLANIHDSGTLELGPGNATDEGGVTNILGNGADPGPDWADFFNASGGVVNGFGGTPAFVADDPSAGSLLDNTVFSGGPGDKNSDIIADWTWTTGNVPAKDDITNAYVYAKTVGGDLIIYVGLEREDPSGSSHVDVEFFQSQVAPSEAPPCDGGGQCGFQGVNLDGDLLANLDYSNGGAFGSLTLRRRQAGVKDNYVEIDDLQGQGCNADETVCAFTNGGPIDGGPWPNFDNHATLITTLPTNSFTEFGINVSELFGGTAPCFATVMVKTRSSQSFTATLKDWSLHGFQQCTASAVTEIHSGPNNGTHTVVPLNSSVPVGTLIHDKVIVTGTSGFAAPTGSVTFSRYSNLTCTGNNPVTENVNLTLVGGVVAAAESTAFSPGPGPLSYKAVYNGDTNYPSGAIAACEPITITRFNSAVNTTIRKDNPQTGAIVLNTAVNLTGGNVNVFDIATITGNGSGPDPTGSVTVARFANGNCSGTPVDVVNVNIVADGNPNDGIAQAISGPHLLSTQTGQFLSFVVTYNGDNVYNPSAASSCEPLCAFPFVVQ